MFIGIYYDENFNRCCKLFVGVDEWHKVTWNPDVVVVDIIDFKAEGRDYNERKESVREIAIKFSNSDLGGLNYGELETTQDWFRIFGRRYGLLREFADNGIC